METGNVISWAKNEGDEVNEGDLLAEIETDKATMSFEASDAGFLAKIIAPAGSRDVPVGSPLCIIVEDASNVAAFKDYVPPEGSMAPAKAAPPSPPPATTAAPAAPPAPAPAASPPAPPPTRPTTPTAAPGQRVFVSPLARKLAAEQGIDVNQLGGAGTGIHGMVRAADLSGAAMSAARAAVGGAAAEAALSGLRSANAKLMTESQLSVPHYYLTMDIQVDELLKVRDHVNATLEKQAGKDVAPAKITLTDLLIKAAAVTCRKIPECNSSWQGNSIRQYNTVDVNIVVPTPMGVMSPVVQGAETKGLLQISGEVSGLVNKAKENKLPAQEAQIGTFTISNLGMFGVTAFSAIISPPQACLLAVGQTQSVLLPDSTATTGFSKKHVISFTLCCDHRVVDGAMGATWLSEFKACLETPALMLV